MAKLSLSSLWHAKPICVTRLSRMALTLPNDSQIMLLYVFLPPSLLLPLHSIPHWFPTLKYHTKPLTWVYSILGPKNSRLHRCKGILWNFSSAKPKCRCCIWSCYASSSLSPGCGPWRGGRHEWELWRGRKKRLGEGEGGEEIWVLCHCLKATSENRAFSAFSGLLRARQDVEQSVSMDTREGRGKKWSNHVPFNDSFSALKSHSIKLYSQNRIHL